MNQLKPTRTRTTRKSNYAILTNATSEAKGKAFHENEWGNRHYRAWQYPSKGSEAMIKALILGWAEYADHYHLSTNFEPHHTLSDDGYAGQYWVDIGRNIIGLLSMDLGRLDGGTLDGLIRQIAVNEGFTKDLT